MNKTVAILGASDDPSRYAYKALKALQSHGYEAIPVNPSKDTIEGLKCYASLSDIPAEIDTVTVYLRPSISSQLIPDIISTKPRRIVLNPGAENEELESACDKAGIQVVRACTLVMLASGQF